MISWHLMGLLHRLPNSYRWNISLTIGCLCLGSLFPQKVWPISPAHNPTPTLESITNSAPSAPLRPVSDCPADLETLTMGLVRDLPSYANRVAYRNFGKFRQFQRPSAVILISQPDFEPLELASRSHTASTAVEESVEQVFLTTLERQYNQEEVVDLQHYHWIFLTQADSGWYLAFMFSRLGAYPSTQPMGPQSLATRQPLTPPRDSSNGLLAEAIRLWLRDCRAEAVYPVESSENGE